MSAAAHKHDLHTIQDIENLPDGVRAELVNGVMYDMATPTWNHQQLIVALSVKIGNYLERKGGDCKLFVAPLAVYLHNDDKNYFEPDLGVICDPSKIDEKGCHGAPDWIIEVTSPSSRRMDYMIKFAEYINAGVREYWIVDEESSRIMVYRLEKGNYEEFSFDDTVPCSLYEDLSIDFKGIV